MTRILIFPVTLNWEWNLSNLGNTRKVTRILIFPVTLNWKWLELRILGNTRKVTRILIFPVTLNWKSNLRILGNTRKVTRIFDFCKTRSIGLEWLLFTWIHIANLGFSIFVKLAPLDWNDFYSHEFTLLTCLGVCRMNLNGTYKNWISQSLWTRVKIL